jgi:hypothetical protein
MAGSGGSKLVIFVAPRAKAKPPVRIQGTRGSDSLSLLQALRLVLCEPYSGAGNHGSDLASCGREGGRGRYRRRCRPADKYRGGFVLGFAQDDDELVRVGDVASCED